VIVEEWSEESTTRGMGNTRQHVRSNSGAWSSHFSACCVGGGSQGGG
jgi:hypothetical protein